MINPDGTNGNIIVAFIGIAISMVVGFVLTMIFYHDEKTGKTGEIDMKRIERKKIRSVRLRSLIRMNRIRLTGRRKQRK